MSSPSGWHRVNRDSPATKARRKRYNSAEHKAARVTFTKLVATGTASCWRCGRHIPPGSDWHVGHSDDGTRIMGPEHARSCNLKAAARKGGQTVMAQRRGRPRPSVTPPRYYPTGL